jgi:hypothetical protein
MNAIRTLYKTRWIATKWVRLGFPDFIKIFLETRSERAEGASFYFWEIESKLHFLDIAEV